MNARTFDRKATALIPAYLERHGIERGDLKIKMMWFGRRLAFRFYHRGTLVADVAGRSEALRWMRESTKEEALEIERAAHEQRLRDVIHFEVTQ
jgi:hypothetical protein